MGVLRSGAKDAKKVPRSRFDVGFEVTFKCRYAPESANVIVCAIFCVPPAWKEGSGTQGTPAGWMLSKLVILSCLVAVAICESKLKVDVVSVPEGCTTKSKNGDMLTMHYTGKLTDGTKFDSRSLEMRTGGGCLRLGYKYFHFSRGRSRTWPNRLTQRLGKL
uniref:peptidylprolyl isomerase n=1 Tax=Anopheles atroparvus TaxID=41427 RepID=A0A182JA98_ANOAO